MSESTYLQPLLRNQENWKTGNILVLLNPSQKQLDGDFSVFLSRLRNPKLCNVFFFIWRPGHHRFPEKLQGLKKSVIKD